MTLQPLRAYACALSAALMLFLPACGGGGDSASPPVPETSAPVPANAFAVRLSPDEVVGPYVVSEASGDGRIELDRAAGVLSGSFSAIGIVPTAAYIHMGSAVTNGPIVLPMIVNSQARTGVLPPSTLTAAQVAALDAGQFYLDVQSAAYPAGELRGQIGGRIVYTASLSGDQQVPAVASTASGTGRVEFNVSTRELSGELNVSGITANAANIRLGPAGATGGVLVRLEDRGSGRFEVPAHTILDDNVWPYLSGWTYFNVQTVANPGGEIRGEIGNRILLATAAGAQQVPPTGSKATGAGYLSYDPDRRTISGSIRLTGMTASAVHIHSGIAGVDGAIEVALVETTSGSGIWHVPVTVVAHGNQNNLPLTRAQARTLLANDTWFEAHSAAFPGGEIRGQIIAGPPSRWRPD